MVIPFVGELCALGAAVCWALALVMFKQTGEHVSALALNLFKNVVGLVLLCLTLLVVPVDEQALASATTRDVLILAFSGVVGIAIADTLLLEALRLLGVGLISIVECLYSPSVLLFAFLLLAEPLTASHLVGAVLIIAGVLIASRKQPVPGRTPRQLVYGVVYGAMSMALMGYGIVIAKPILDGKDFPLIPATTIRLLAGTVLLAVFAVASPSRRRHFAAFRPTSVWRLSVPGSVLGMYLALILWMAGFKFANASIAAILNQTSIIFAIILASLILKEPFTRRRLLATTLAFAGVVVVALEVA